jgi:hypothetical protein
MPKYMPAKTKQLTKFGWKYLIENFEKVDVLKKKKKSCTLLRKGVKVGVLIVQLSLS